MTEYLVVIEREGDSWGAFCPDLPGVGVVADTREEVELLIRDAISIHLEGLRLAGDPIPAPTAIGTTLVQVPAA
jgi:predicted RNase H-like HicB family nuclease